MKAVRYYEVVEYTDYSDPSLRGGIEEVLGKYADREDAEAIIPELERQLKERMKLPRSKGWPFNAKRFFVREAILKLLTAKDKQPVYYATAKKDR